MSNVLLQDHLRQITEHALRMVLCACLYPWSDHGGESVLDLIVNAPPQKKKEITKEKKKNTRLVAPSVFKKYWLMYM